MTSGPVRRGVASQVGSMRSGAPRPPVPSAVAVADVLGKVVLAGFLLAVLVDPAWGNLEGKAPTPGP